MNKPDYSGIVALREILTIEVFWSFHNPALNGGIIPIVTNIDRHIPLSELQNIALYFTKVSLQSNIQMSYILYFSLKQEAFFSSK